MRATNESNAGNRLLNFNVSTLKMMFSTLNNDVSTSKHKVSMLKNVRFKYNQKHKITMFHC